MAEKATCPACSSHGSDVRFNFERDNPCPRCGLSSQAAAEVLHIRTLLADEELKKRLEQMTVEFDRLSREAEAMRGRLRLIKDALDGVDLSY